MGVQFSEEETETCILGGFSTTMQQTTQKNGSLELKSLKPVGLFGRCLSVDDRRVTALNSVMRARQRFGGHIGVMEKGMWYLPQRCGTVVEKWARQ